LDPGGKGVDVFIQSMGFKTVEDLGTEGVEVDGIPPVHLVAGDGPETTEGLGTEKPPLGGRENEVETGIQVEVELGADVITGVQREPPLPTVR